MIPILLIILVVAFVLFVSYNSIITKRNATEKAYATLDAILKKRFDILPNVVASVQQSMAFESGILEKIVSLRNATANTTLQSEDRIHKENELSTLLSKVLVTVENYPDLKSNTNIAQLQKTIIDIERDIAIARDDYNNQVLAYNTQIETVPGKWVADEMKATRKNYFEANVTEKENVSVRGLFGKE
jgi:LemA protein